MPSVLSSPDDLLRQYMLMSGVNTPQKGIDAPMATTPLTLPEGMPGSAAELIKSMLKGTSTGVVPKDVPNDRRQAPGRLDFAPMPRAAEAKITTEDMFKTPDGWKDRNSQLIDQAKKLLNASTGAGKTEGEGSVVVGVPEKATAPTPEPHPFEGQYTQNFNSPKDAAEFYAMMRPQAEKIAAATGLDVDLVLAKIALETGYGKHAPGFNYFGIKETDPAKGQVLATKEEVDGKLVDRKERFRTYASLDESVADYIKFLKENSRYSGFLQAKGIDAQLEALQKSGYATDSKYAEKIRAIIKAQKAAAEANRPAVANVPPNTPEPPPEPGKRVGEHQRGWFWNGTTWDKAYARGGHIRDLLDLSRNYR